MITAEYRLETQRQNGTRKIRYFEGTRAQARQRCREDHDLFGECTAIHFLRYLPLSEEDRVNSSISKQQMICSNFQWNQEYQDWTYRR